MSWCQFFKISFFMTAIFVSGCGYLRIDPYHYLIRSDVVSSKEIHDAIVAKAKLGWTDDGRVRVIYVSGTPYERGYQQGVLLREEIKENLGLLYKNALATFKSEILFEEVYERMRPFIPQEYVDEMHGLAHGAKIPLKLVHYIHVLPEITEWGGKKRLREVIHQMIKGAVVPSCSNLCVSKSATKDNRIYTVRILDWGLHKISKLHKYPLITVSVPDKGIPSANIGWVGFIGAVSGINAKGITLGEMGNGDPENETLNGKPMPFLLRDVLTYASSLKDVRRLIKNSPGTNSFGFLMTDGKTGQSELYVKDRDRFQVFHPNEHLKDEFNDIPAIKDALYGGHDTDALNSMIKTYHGQITPEILMEKIIPATAMKSNFQNVVYDPAKLQFWVDNAANKEQPAFTQPYTFFDFGKYLKNSLGNVAN